MRKEMSTWENELWHYLETGNGETCPLYDVCDMRKDGHWCIIDHREFIGDLSYLINSHEIDPSRGEILRTIKPGRIFNLVEMLANRYLELSGIDSPPVPESLIEDIGQPNNVEVRLLPLTYYHGALWYMDDAWVIQLNSNDEHSVRRLTLFHEAFHVLAHSNSTPIFRKISSNKGAFNELLAEYFTYNILMPEPWVRNKWEQVKDPDIMAKMFEVPKSAMITILSSLQLIDATSLVIPAYHSAEKAVYAYNDRGRFVDA